MIFSMTGFAATERETPNGLLVTELRSVNHRYLELQLKLDDNLRAFEPMIRELINSNIVRGKVECRMSLISRVDSDNTPELDAGLLQNLAKMADQVQQYFPHTRDLSVADILRWPGVIKTQAASSEMLEMEIRESVLKALDEMRASRAREGEKLKNILLERLVDMDAQLAIVRPLLPMQIRAFQERLTARLHETLKTVDEERIAQEIVVYAQRIDVDEELSRLQAHISEVRRILSAEGAAGKRLDFLMQELNREANTLGSKSVSTEVTQVSMTLKVLIEQMREQIQNIE